MKYSDPWGKDIYIIGLDINDANDKLDGYIKSSYIFDIERTYLTIDQYVYKGVPYDSYEDIVNKLSA